MISFVNDYNEGACPEVLEALTQYNHEKNSSYGSDDHTQNAIRLIREKIGNDSALIHFFCGGTQTNLVALCAFLRPHEAVIAVKTGHICVHETGAIEATGHKCIEVDGKDGKVTVADIEKVCGDQHWDHAGILTVKPKLVYISQTTEIGTVYNKEELYQLRAACNRYGLYLYCDGARLASALDCSDVSYELLAELCDSFYIGGSKNGALFGEALVIVNDRLKEDFGYIAKQRGGVLAKGWLLSLQFERLMEGDLYKNIGAYSNQLAIKLQKGLLDLGLKARVASPSNQQFFVFPDRLLQALKGKFDWENIERIDSEHTEIRLVTSWTTKEEEVYLFLQELKNVLGNNKEFI